MRDDFLHRWAKAVQHYRNIVIRERIMVDLLRKNRIERRKFEKDMEYLLEKYNHKRKGKSDEKCNIASGASGGV